LQWFFSTTALVTYRSIWDQADRYENANKVLQATYLAHGLLDEIEAKLFSKQVAFKNVVTTFTGSQTIDMPYVGSTFICTYAFAYTDSMGVA